MTIGASNRNDAIGNDTATVFPYGFKIFAATHLEVKVKKTSDGSITTLTYPTQFSVSGVGNAGGGNVTLADVDGAWQNASDGTLKTGYTLSIRRVVPLQQSTDLRNQGNFRASTHEDAFDYAMMVNQQQADDLLRAVRLDSSYDVDDYNMTLPAPVANGAIGFNSAGTGLAIISSLSGTATTAFTASLLDDANGDAFLDTLTSGLNAESSPAVSDRLILDDVSAGTWDTITLENLWKVINGFTEDATPDLVGDFLNVYDTSASGIKKVRPVMLGMPSQAVSIRNGYIDWSVSGNVLTAAIKTLAGTDPSATDPAWILFRSVTVTDGKPVERKITSATSISINDTATLGTVNSIAFRLWCVAFDDGGTVRLGLINCVSHSAGAGTGRDVTAIYPLAAWDIASSTLEDNASDSAQVFYTDGAAVTSKAYTTLGYATWESGLATAGTWSGAPTREHAYVPGATPLPGQHIQSQITPSGTGGASLGTGTIPNDNTIPQNTEGNEWTALNTSITPISAANILDVRFTGWVARGAADNTVCAAMFRDSTANALKATDYYYAQLGTTLIVPIDCQATVLAESASATTFKLRVGATSGINIWPNSDLAGAQLFAGVAASRCVVKERMG